MPPDADWWTLAKPDDSKPVSLEEARADVVHLRYELQRMVDQLRSGKDSKDWEHMRAMNEHALEVGIEALKWRRPSEGTKR